MGESKGDVMCFVCALSDDENGCVWKEVKLEIPKLTTAKAIKKRQESEGEFFGMNRKHDNILSCRLSYINESHHIVGKNQPTEKKTYKQAARSSTCMSMAESNRVFTFIKASFGGETH